MTQETRASITAHTGHASEHMTKYYIDRWVEDVTNGDIKIGYDIKEITKRAYDILGSAEFKQIDFDSKKSADAIIAHAMKNYELSITKVHHVGIGGPKEIQRITGFKSNADLLMKTKPMERGMEKFLEYLGASLKYSKQRQGGNPIKLHSPTIQTLISIVEEHDETTSLKQKLEKVATTGLRGQQESLSPHDGILSDTFLTPFKYRGDSCNYKNELLSQGAVSWIRDQGTSELRQVYDDMSVYNLHMKRDMAKVLYTCLNKILTNKPRSVQENLLRSISNTRKDKIQLPTFVVLTERHKEAITIADTLIAFEKYFKMNDNIDLSRKEDSSVVIFGPGSLTVDCRPTTVRNPLSFPVNYYLNRTKLRMGE